MRVHALIDETGTASDLYATHDLAGTAAAHLNNEGGEQSTRHRVRSISVDTTGGAPEGGTVWSVTDASNVIESVHGTRGAADAEQARQDHADGCTSFGYTGREVQGHRVIGSLPNIPAETLEEDGKIARAG